MKSPAMIGTVPMYDAIGYLEKPLIGIKAQDFLDVVRAHAEDGVDFVTIHAGMNRRTIENFKETGRLMNIVSRGGSLIFAWMEATGNENPFYEYYDEVLEILHEHDVTISHRRCHASRAAPTTQPTPARSPSSSRSASSPSARGTRACR